MRFPTIRAALLIVAAMLTVAVMLRVTTAADSGPTCDYAVVVSKATQDDADWAKVVATLKAKHGATVLVYDAAVTDALDDLRKLHPRYTCFVAKPADAGRQFVADVHTMTRKLDDDLFTDTLWGILTGYDGACALSIAEHDKPLLVRRSAAGTELALDMCEAGICYDELVKGKVVEKKPGEDPIESKGPDDTTAALIDTLQTYKADLLVTSGHASERDWMIGFRYRNGYFKSQAGQMFGLDTQGKRIEIDAPHPRVYLAVGNCLMGHINGPDAMALAWMNDCGVRQMVGYTVPTWYGYGGWGCLDYFVEQPGRYTLAEAFHANHHALVHRLMTYFPGLANAEISPGGRARISGAVDPEQAKTLAEAGLTMFDGSGLLHDRDVVAFYGDPKWSATMADLPKAWDQNLTEADGIFTFEIKPNRGEKTFDPINTNGSQRGGRPIIELFPRRLTDIELIEGEDLDPVLADDFLLIPNPGKCEVDRTYRVRFKAKPVE